MGNALLVMFGSIILVFLAAVVFVNAIEYCGMRLHLGSSFVGAILAPLFTSFPELTVFLVAVFAYGGAAGQDIGIGTLFGQPFMASSLSYGLVGIAALIGWRLAKRTDSALVVDKSLAIPYIFITILFPLTLVPALLDTSFARYVMGTIFLGAFVVYVCLMFRSKEAELIEEAEDSYLHRFGRKVIPWPMVAALVQIVVAVALLYVGSEKMVRSVDVLASRMGMSTLGLALIVVPAATAIPETASALLWGYRGKDTLSLGSLVGEKILYSTFYPGLGLFLTSWDLDRHAYFSVAATTVVSSILLYFILKGRLPWFGLMTGLFFFVAYAILMFAFNF
ncbi:MAG: sodium:calcium antiporter [Chloroflexota bacterium]